VAGLVPDQDPEAVHAVALVADQVSVALLPLATVLGLAARLTVGTGWVTETVVDCAAALPPVPVQVSVYVAFAVRVPVDCVPVSALAPAHAPDAVQEVALLDDQVRVDALPLRMVLGLALKLIVTVGFALTVTVAVCAAVPPPPVHVRV
jgi:hypothetical protein